jgi:putative ABC transport system ATP-binding protein
MTALLETRGLRKQYRLGEITVDALRGIDFSIQQKQFVAIMGPSGSGKSTLMHLLGGLDDATGGEILLAGQPLTQMSDDQITITRRRHIGFIFQSYNLIPTLTAAENVALPLLMDGRVLTQYTAHIDELLALVGLEDRKKHKPHQLSGGQQQRVAIARALVMEPRLVLADEPTGNLDSAAGLGILQLLRHACDDKGQTIVMVTHDRQAAAFAERVVFLKDGCIVRDLAFSDSADRRRTQEIAAVTTELGF